MGTPWMCLRYCIPWIVLISRIWVVRVLRVLRAFFLTAAQVFLYVEEVEGWSPKGMIRA